MSITPSVAGLSGVSGQLPKTWSPFQETFSLWFNGTLQDPVATQITELEQRRQETENCDTILDALPLPPTAEALNHIFAWDAPLQHLEDAPPSQAAVVFLCTGYDEQGFPHIRMMPTQISMNFDAPLYVLLVNVSSEKFRSNNVVFNLTSSESLDTPVAQTAFFAFPNWKVQANMSNLPTTVGPSHEVMLIKPGLARSVWIQVQPEARLDGSLLFTSAPQDAYLEETDEWIYPYTTGIIHEPAAAPVPQGN